MDFHFDPTNGNDAFDGSAERPWATLSKANRILFDSAPGTRLLFRSGTEFRGTLEIGCAAPVAISTYGGDARATIASDSDNALNYWGTGGLTVRNLKLVGTGDGDTYHAGARIAANARGITLENVEATGYRLGGVLLMGGDLRDVTLRRCFLHHNANGLFVSGPTVRGLRVLDTECSDNDIQNHSSSGFGMSINGAEDIEISGCRVHRNGRNATGGGSGLMLYLCRHAVIRHTEAHDNLDPNPETGDGQGIVIDDSWDVLVEACHAHRNGNGGIQIHDEFQGSSPRNVTVRSCTLEDNVVGIDSQGGAGGLLWEGSHVRCTSRDGKYRVAANLHLPSPGTRFHGGRLEAQDGAHLLVAEVGLGRTAFEGVAWSSRTPSIVVRGVKYTSIAAALRAEPLVLGGVARAAMPRHGGRIERLQGLLASLNNRNLEGVA